MERDTVVSLHSEFVPAGFQLYLLNFKHALQLEEAEPGRTLAVVVMIRKGGFSLALPELAMTAEILEEGSQPGSQGLVGPSVRLEVACWAIDEEAFADLPATVEGRVMTVLLVDFADGILPDLREVQTKEDLEAAHGFDVLEPYLVPSTEDLVSKAIAWIDGGSGIVWNQDYSSIEERGSQKHPWPPRQNIQPDGAVQELVLVETGMQRRRQREPGCHHLSFACHHQSTPGAYS